MKRNLRCGECGSKNISLRNVKGSVFSYKEFPALKLNCDLELNQCEECENIILLSDDTEKLDHALEETIRLDSKEFILEILEQKNWNQNHLSDFIGLSSVYISELKNGKKYPKMQTYNYLKILSKLPAALDIILDNDLRYKHWDSLYDKSKVENSLYGKATISVNVEDDKKEEVEAADSYEPVAMAA